MAVWLILLAAYQGLDVLTTKINLGYGALEGNSTSAAILATGGMAKFLAVKLVLVVALVLASLIIRSWSKRAKGRRPEIGRILLWRGLQFCVLVMALTSVHNVVVLLQVVR